MKNLLIMVAVAVLFCGIAQADPATSSANQTSTATGTATNQGNAQNITFTSPPTTTQTIEYGSDQVVRNTPSVSGPPLTTSNDTCMGSTSGSLNIAGFGVGGGSTWTDTNCKMLKNSREMWNMGMKAASLALMCNDELNKDALELTGYTCPQTDRARKQAADRNEPPIVLHSSSTMVKPTGPSVYAGVDPIIRARLGLPALKAAQ